MKRCTIYTKTVLLILLLLASGCIKPVESVSIATSTVPVFATASITLPVSPLPTEMPDIGLSINDINSEIRLYPYLPFKTDRTNTTISFYLGVRTVGNEAVAFPVNYNALIFTYVDNHWKELQNELIYPNGTDDYSMIIEPYNGDSLVDGTLNIILKTQVLQELGSRVGVRVIISGRIFRNNQVTDEWVFSYFDAILHP